MSSIVNKELLDWVEEVYDNYLSNFVIPICPPELDVQPEFYLPMKKEWFIESLLEDNQRGNIFRQKWGVNFDIRELNLEEKEWLLEKTNCINDIENDRVIYGHDWESYINEQYNCIQLTQNIVIPKQIITLTYNNKTVTYYE